MTTAETTGRSWFEPMTAPDNPPPAPALQDAEPTPIYDQVAEAVRGRRQAEAERAAGGGRR